MSDYPSITFNKKAHDAIVDTYESKHPEIFSDIEQSRLRDALVFAKSSIISGSVSALDVGSGTGNLVRHLIDIGMEVTASDVSEASLAYVAARYKPRATHVLNGTDLSELPDASYDMVTTYSVLHHIPDYLHMVSEMCRVLKPGGVLYIDHEKNDAFWQQDPALQAFYRSQRWALLPSKLRKLLSPMWYVHRYRRFRNPRYQAEGDIHVWTDDYVEWEKVVTVAKAQGVQVLRQDDFLLFDTRYNQTIYDKAKDSVSDTRAVIFIKK